MLLPTPILFLDYDGVLHPSAVYRRSGEDVVLEPAGHDLFEWAGILTSLLEPYPAIRLILATSWVWNLGFDATVARLPVELQSRVVGATWQASLDQDEWAYLPRFEQILLAAQSRELSRWLAVDDDNDCWPETEYDRLVLTHPKLGLSSPETQRDLADKLATLCVSR